MTKRVLAILLIGCSCTTGLGQIRPELRVGGAGHAFDHFGGFSEQAEAAAASGATIIYATGLGGVGYSGLPPEVELAAQRDAIRQYNRSAKEQGIELVLGYLCATSIVKLDTFDQHWTDELRGQFKTAPAEWRQMDGHGKPLESWYGGDYEPACMNNPDWRGYQTYMVRHQLETGHDGIFFDNPTVHPDGCYCPHCLDKFAAFLRHESGELASSFGDGAGGIDAIRRLAVESPNEFQKFRSTTAREFLRHIRKFARTIDPDALITCNNSLNSPQRLYAQCRVHAYNIAELSKVQDIVVVEDMLTQPRVAPDGQVFEYGHTYKQLHAISRKKPIVATNLVSGNYHTPPRLMRLAMSEAAAHNASYLSWPTWPENERQRMIAAVRPQAEMLRRTEPLLNDAPFRADVVLFLPFRRWLETDKCTASDLAAALTKANVQYEVISEDGFDVSERSGRLPVLLVESLLVLTPAEKVAVDGFQANGGSVIVAEDADWLEQVNTAIDRPSVVLNGPPTVRAVVHDHAKGTIIHLFNLNIEPVSSFEDKVNPANDVGLTVRVPFEKPSKVSVHSADDDGSSAPTEFAAESIENGSLVSFTIPRLEISAIALIEP